MSFSFGYEEDGDVTTTADISALPRSMRAVSEGTQTQRAVSTAGDKVSGVRRLSSWFTTSLGGTNTSPKKQKFDNLRAPVPRRGFKGQSTALEIDVKECTESTFTQVGLVPPQTPTYALRVRPTPKQETLATAPSPVIASSSFFVRSRHSELEGLTSTLADCNLQPTPAVQQALSLPEIVDNILQRLDDQCFVATSSINQRAGATRDKARSITLDAFGQAVEVDWAAEAERCKGALSACMTVNTIFNDAACRVLARRIELTDPAGFDSYVDSQMAQENGCRDLLLHKLAVDQERLDSLHQTRLVSLELYVCPQLIPSSTLLGAHGQLTKLALPGCGRIDDAFLFRVAKQCPRLKILDLRACEEVTDAGIIAVARACRGLQYLNVGRVGNAHRLTDRSVFEVARLTQVETLGVAGCRVGDEGIYAVSEYRGHAIERLSLNACEGITDWSIGKLLKHAPKLQVLELVRCPRVMDASSILKFKRKSKALVEVDESLQAEMDEVLRIRSLRRRTMPELGRDARNVRRISSV